MKILDGLGNGNVVGVNAHNRLLSDCIETSRIADASAVGNTFGFCTNFRSFTAANGEQGLFFLQPNYDETRINSFRLSSTVNGLFRIRVDIEGGTLKTDGSAMSLNNLNRKSNKEFDGIALKGADGLTVGFYPHLICISVQAYNPIIIPFEDALILTQGDTLAVTFAPAADGQAACAGILYNPNY